LLLVFELGAESIARVLTGGESSVATEACAEALRWMLPAAVAHLFAGLAASGLASLDDYGTAALGYALGSAVGPVYILTRIDDDGIVAVSRGILVNGVVALLVPASVLAWKAWRSRMPAGAVRPAGQPLLSRLGLFATAAALPIALQLLYVVCLPFAGRLGSGAVTSFGYAYLIAASFVSVTAFSIGLVSSVPLTRQGLGPGAAARHVVSSSWIAFTLIAPAVGLFALTGGDVIEQLLGSAYGGDVGAEIGQIIFLLVVWMVASVGVNVAFPLAFVADRLRSLPWIGALALALQVVLAWVGVELLELTGLALALGLTTLFVLAALLRELDALALGVRGVAIAALVIGGLALAAFLPSALVLGAIASALSGLVIYVTLVALVRPRELRSSWAYLRALR
jgi:peptidoglycan biosynthesis protein MviN/MurJ (putative lipid II flippase)